MSSFRLGYLAQGERNYPPRKPSTHLYPRNRWEYQAVIQGEMGLMTPSQMEPLFRSEFLWIMDPDLPHD